jgi:hypothetical protein
MKMSLCQMIAIAVLFALSLICVDTYVEQAKADSYTLIVSHYDVYYCTN